MSDAGAAQSSSGESKKTTSIIAFIIGGLFALWGIMLVIAAFSSYTKDTFSPVITFSTVGIVAGGDEIGWEYYTFTGLYLLIGIGLILLGVHMLKK